MKHLASKQEVREFGSLGYKMSVEEMKSQCKVMYDDIGATKPVDKEDELRLLKIKDELIQAILTFESISELNGA